MALRRAALFGLRRSSVALPATLVPQRLLPALAPAMCGPVACLAKKGKGGGGKAKGGKEKKGAVTGGETEEVAYEEVDFADVERRMQGAIDAMQRDLATLNVGRASPTMLDALAVSSPDGAMPLPSVAKVMLLSPQSLQVSVFDAPMVPAVVKAIEGAELGLVAEAAGKMVKVSVPRATGEARDLMAKQVKKMGEACRVAIRNVRQPAMKRAKAHPVKDGAKRAEKQVEKLTEGFGSRVDAAVKAKEKELQQV